MARPERYFIGPGVRDAIRDTILRVGAMPVSGGGGGDIATRLQTIGQPDQTPRLGKTTALWSKGTTATVELYEEGTPPSEQKKSPAETLTPCVNKFADVQANKWVMVSLAGNGYWYLIAAEC